MNECEVVGRKFVVPRCHAATVLDLVEEPLDQIAGTIEIRAEADRLVAIAPWRDVGPCAFLGRKGSDPIGVIATRPGLTTASAVTQILNGWIRPAACAPIGVR